MQITIKQSPTFNNAYWRIFLNIQHKYGSGGRFLEIGAADPERTAVLASRYRHLVGLDLDFARLNRINNIMRCNGDACRLPFKDQAFDGVIAHHVIEHLLDDDAFVCEMHRVLKDGGFAILGTPNRDRLASLLRNAVCGKRKFPWREHVREYDKNGLRDLFDEKGFSKVNITGNFIGIHAAKLVVGFDRCPRMLERWCNFWFIELLR